MRWKAWQDAETWESMYFLMEAQMHIWRVGNGLWRCSRMKWKVEWSETCSSSWERTCNFLGKNLQFLPKWRKNRNANKQNTKTNTKKHMSLAKDSNMSTSKPLQHANSNLEFGKNSKVWKWEFSSFLKANCTFHGIYMDKLQSSSNNMHGNSKISMSWWASLKMSTYL